MVSIMDFDRLVVKHKDLLCLDSIKDAIDTHWLVVLGSWHADWAAWNNLAKGPCSRLNFIKEFKLDYEHNYLVANSQSLGHNSIVHAIGIHFASWNSITNFSCNFESKSITNSDYALKHCQFHKQESCHLKSANNFSSIQPIFLVDP